MGDLRLDEFLRVCKDINLPDGRAVTIRVLSDLELNARRDYALSESVKTAEQLKDPTSDLFKLKIAPLIDSTKDSLIDMLANARRMELVREAQDVYRMDFYPNPDNATEQELIEVRLKQAAHERDVYANRAKHVIEGEQKYRDKMAEYPLDVIIKESQARAVQVYSASVSGDAFGYFTIWCAVESGGRKHWKSVEDASKLPSVMIDYLLNEYQKVDAIDPWALTKSKPERTPNGVGQDDPAGERQPE